MMRPVFAIIDAPIIAIMLFLGVFAIIPAWFIARKAVYSPWLSLLLVIPYAAIVLYIIFAIVEWPVQKEVKALRKTLWAQAQQA